MGTFTSTSPRIFSLAGLLPVFLFALWTAAAALADSEPEPAQEPDCVPGLPDEDVAARMFGAGADDLDLFFKVEWEDDLESMDFVSLEVYDGQDKLVASQVVRPKPGEVTLEVVTSLLADVGTHGLAYRIELGPGLAKPLPVFVEIVCPPGRDCRFEPAVGISAEAIVVDPELGNVLATLVDPASADLLGEVLDDYPHLLGAVAAFALQLRQLDSDVGIPLGECSCAWMIQFPRTPKAVEEGDESVPFEDELRWDLGPGAAHQVIAQGIAGATHAEYEGTTAVKTYLDCAKLVRWIPNALAVPLPSSAGVLLIDRPVLVPCEDQCAGQVVHELYFDGYAAAVANDGNPDPFDQTSRPGLADASETVVYEIGDQTIFDEPMTATASAAAGGRKTDANHFCKTDQRFVTAPSEATLTATAAVGTLGGQTISRCYLAEVTTEYMMVALTEAACALNRTTVNSIEAQAHNDFYEGLNAAAIWPPVSTSFQVPTKSGVTKEPWCP